MVGANARRRVCLWVLAASIWLLALPARAQPCTGDCNEDGRVAISELIAAVNVALGNVPLASCQPGDASGNGTIEINELIAAVKNALGGCPTPGPTPTPSPDVPRVARRAASMLATHVAVLVTMPDAFAVLLREARPPSAGSGAETVFERGFSCPDGGGGSLRCDQDIFPPLPPFAPMYRILLDACTVVTAGSRSVMSDGTLVATGEDGQVCEQVPSTLRLSFPNLSVRAAGQGGISEAALGELQASAVLSGADPECQYDRLGLRLTGSLAAAFDDGAGGVHSAAAIFNDTDALVSVEQFSLGCVPQVYTMSANGQAASSRDTSIFDAVYEGFELGDDATSGRHLVVVSGSIASPCFGETVEVATLAALDLATGALCPRAGAVEVTSAGGTDVVRYTAAGGVEIDLAEGGTEKFASCLDPRLLECPAGEGGRVEQENESQNDGRNPSRARQIRLF